MLRVTVGSTSQAALRGLQENASRLQKLQAQLSSGKQITTPSDDPSGTIQALQLRGESARNAQYATNAGNAIAFMSTADTTYQQIQTLVQKARTLVVQGLNAGTGTGTSEAAIADQVDAIKRAVYALANTTYNGQPVFGGTTANDGAYQAQDSTGTAVPIDSPDVAKIVYVGDPGRVNRQVGPSTTVQINQTGADVFGLPSTDPANSSGAPDLFELLTNVSDALNGVAGAPPLAGDPASGIPSALDQLDAARQRVSTAQAAEGATYKQVENAQTVQASAKVALKTQLSRIQDIDLAAMTVQVSTAQVAYQAALQTTAGISQMSLLNFLR